jgi:F-type H+-transporting ATPase subunit a
MTALLSNSYFCGLSPGGVPFMLSPFLVVVECVSLFVRPVSLMVRILVNMLCGHMLLNVAGILIIGGFIVPFLLVLLLESMVVIVQAVVFGTLLSLY